MCLYCPDVSTDTQLDLDLLGSRFDLELRSNFGVDPSRSCERSCSICLNPSSRGEHDDANTIDRLSKVANVLNIPTTINNVVDT